MELRIRRAVFRWELRYNDFMLEKPPIAEAEIAAILWDAYVVPTSRITFLPLGADVNTAVYRVESGVEAYFLKLRRNFDPLSVLVPTWLGEQGLRQVIAPLRTGEGALFTTLLDYACILYPFITGADAYANPLSENQWRTFGTALRTVHNAALPPELRVQLPRETFSDQIRVQVRHFQARAQAKHFDDPHCLALAAAFHTYQAQIDTLLERAGALADVLRDRPPELVLCHSDIHAWNLLLAETGDLYMVDWDEPILAPKERDLMFIGAGLGGIWNTSREEALFYEGYGAAVVDRQALAYYRCERIAADLAAIAEQIFDRRGSSPDREQGLRFFTSNFHRGGVFEIACRTDR